MNSIKTESGLVCGTAGSARGKEVFIFRGIPYAAPPVGQLRWQPPRPAEPWRDVRECNAYGDAAPQEPPGPPFPQQARSEDCLTLNILTPARDPGERLPVMVWLHGGGYVVGCANNRLYSSEPLPQHGVVLVTVNHRLGVLGLMAHPLLSKESPYKVSGNYMLLDIIESLIWIQRNIAAFGGDPDNITIFGESGGGGKVACLMASPVARRLFQRAICQSGTAVSAPFFGGKPLRDLEALGEKYFEVLGVNKAPDPLAAARAIPWEKLLQAEQQLAKKLGLQRDVLMLWDAAIDGWLLPDTPTNIFKARQHNRVPLIAGANRGELTTGMVILPWLIPAYVEMLTDNLKAGTRSYAYIFDRVPPGWQRKGMKSVHGMELNYLFGLSEARDWETVFPGPPNPDPGLNDGDRRVAEAMMAMWAQFAKTGDPSVKGLVEWPPYDPATDKYLNIADPPEVRTGFSKAARGK